MRYTINYYTTTTAITATTTTTIIITSLLLLLLLLLLRRHHDLVYERILKFSHDVVSNAQFTPPTRRVASAV